MNVEWSKEATLDLKEITDYISKDRVSEARTIYKKIKLSCKKLKASPRRCRRVPELSDVGLGTYREIILTPYRIIFKLTETNVYIIAVVDGRRGVESFIFNRLLRSG
ncbi:MAG: type II toxin-antitoxin system RelE/ParE family toxin [bacterium]|nr:type II toxin-antitoxin system RelE/ParE family toxin [bacterium]